MPDNKRIEPMVGFDTQIRKPIAEKYSWVNRGYLQPESELDI